MPVQNITDFYLFTPLLSIHYVPNLNFLNKIEHIYFSIAYNIHEIIYP